jgi:thiamine biosynthesis lipoprotein
MTRTIPNSTIRKAAKVFSFNPSQISSNYRKRYCDKVIKRKIYSNISILLILLYVPTFVFAQYTRQVFNKPLMGSQFRIVIDSADSVSAKIAADSAFNRISVLNGIMSDYLDGSEVNRLSASSGTNTWVDVSSDLYEIIEKSVEISKQTNGYFDISVGPVVQEWRRAIRRNYFPSKKTIRNKRRAVGYQHIQFDSSNRRIKLLRPDMKLDLGGIGKGYAADQAIIVLKNLGFQSVLVDAGGDLTISNPPTGKQGWEIEITSGTSETDSLEHLIISNTGIATSGATYRYLEHKGGKYSHIVNPRTGIGLLHHVRTTVIAPTGTLADALSTAVSIAGIRKSKKMIKKFPEVKVWLLETKDGRLSSWNSIKP